MRTLRIWSIATLKALPLIALLTPAAHAATLAPGAVARPNGRGDQVIAYYDARDGFTSFVNLRNETSAPLSVTILFYDPAFDPPFTRTLVIDAASLTTFDIGALKGEGLAGTPGVAIATTVNPAGAPIVTRGLGGNFTVANLATGAAWGAPALARVAVEPSATQPPPAKTPAVPFATVIDGVDVLLPPIQPTSVDLATFFDPERLTGSGGNDQVIFLAIEDVPGPTYTARAGSASWNFAGLDAQGSPTGRGNFTATGVTVTDLVSVAGASVNGASGSMTFTAVGTTAPVTRVIFFTESLGTFSTGYLLPRAGRS